MKVRLFFSPCVTHTDPGYQVFVAPPPNAGGALLSFLNIVEGFKYTGQNQDGASHWIAEVLLNPLN